MIFFIFGIFISWFVAGFIKDRRQREIFKKSDCRFVGPSVQLAAWRPFEIIDKGYGEGREYNPLIGYFVFYFVNYNRNEKFVSEFIILNSIFNRAILTQDAAKVKIWIDDPRKDQQD